MNIARAVALAAGIVALLIGLVWAGQGSGTFPYPASSFMIDQRPWIYRGLALAAVGLLVIVMSRRRPRG